MASPDSVSTSGESSLGQQGSCVFVGRVVYIFFQAGPLTPHSLFSQLGL